MLDGLSSSKPQMTGMLILGACSSTSHGAGETLTVTERGQEVARLVPSGPDIDPYYLELAEKYGATIPKGDLVETSRNLPPRRNPTPAGTTDAILAEDRRDRV